MCLYRSLPPPLATCTNDEASPMVKIPRRTTRRPINIGMEIVFPYR
jgi:hypothetical protein